MMKSQYFIVLLAVMLQSCGGGILNEKVADYDSLIETGWEYYNQRRYDEAYQVFLDSKEDDSQRPEAYIGCGWALLRRQHPDSAIVVFRNGFTYITSLEDTVDALCGLAGSYLARGDDSKVIDLFSKYTVSSYDDAFPLKKHDFFLEESDLEIVRAMAFYRLGLYSSDDKADPDNAAYHVNQVLHTPVEFTDPQTLMRKIMDYMEQTKGEYYL